MSSPSLSPSSSSSYRLSATAPCFPQPKAALAHADGFPALQASPEISASIGDEQAVANLIASPPHRTAPLPSSLMASKPAAQGLERLDIPALPSIWSAAGGDPCSNTFESPVTPASSPLFTPASTRHPSSNWHVNASMAPGTRVLGDFSRSSPCLPLLGHDPSSSPGHATGPIAGAARASFDYIPPQLQQQHQHHHASTSPLLGHAFSSPPPAPAQRVQSSAYTPPPPSRSKSFFNTLSRAASWRPIQPLLPPVIGPNQPHALLPPNIVGSPPSSLNATHFALDPGISTGLHQQRPQTREPPASKITRPRRETLYKTELCRSWEERGHCEYGEKCQFAHGPNELRTVSRHPKWKTELCRTYWREGACPYAKRCCFIHELHERQGSRPSSFDTHRPPLLARVRAGSSQEDVAAFACSPSSTSSSPTTTHLQQERANPSLTGRFGSSSFDLGRTRMASNNSTSYDLSKSSVSFSFSTSLGGGAATGSSSSLASARNSDLFGGIGLGISIPTTTPATTTRPALPRSRTDPALNATLRASTSST